MFDFFKILIIVEFLIILIIIPKKIAMIIMAKGLPSSIKDGNLNKSKPNGLIESLTSNLSKLLKFNSDIKASLIGKLT